MKHSLCPILTDTKKPYRFILIKIRWDFVFCHLKLLYVDQNTISLVTGHSCCRYKICQDVLIWIRGEDIFFNLIEITNDISVLICSHSWHLCRWIFSWIHMIHVRHLIWHQSIIYCRPLYADNNYMPRSFQPQSKDRIMRFDTPLYLTKMKTKHDTKYQPFTCLVFERRHKMHFQFISYLHKNMAWEMKSVNDLPSLQSEYHGCGWPGDASSQGIRNHDNDVVNPE